MTLIPPPSETAVLAVDDNDLNLELLKQELGDLGYQVIAAGSGREALDLLERRLPDIVLLDIMMPGLSGLDVLKELRSRPDTRTLPVILVTAKSESRDIVEGLGTGANDYVTKPIDTDVLVARMQTQLRLRALQDEIEQRNERVRRELQEARRVQLSLLPSADTLASIHSTHGLRILSYSRVAEALGGDFWDVINLADGTLGILIADFSGHGVIPAFHTFRIKTFLHSSLSGLSNCGLAMARINAMLARDLPPNDYATCLYAQYLRDHRRMAYANAGHPGPLLYRRSTGMAHRLPEGGKPAGVSADAAYVESEEALQQGDVILFYTNGLTGLTDSQGQTLGVGGVEEAFLRGASIGIQDAKTCLVEAVRDYGGEDTPNDDLTFVLIEVVE